jgi:argininosuccinate lyase
MLHIAGLITELQSALLNKAKEYADAPAPGFTHLQHAQPILFGHELAKHVHAFARDLDRINDWLARTSYSPLGAGALAGSSLPIKTRRDR